MAGFIQELRNRAMLHSLMPGTEQLLRTSRVKAYIGIDPTAPSLHIGNLATLMLLRHFQAAGHQPLVLLGGATAMIGDPSFKAAERKLLARGTIERNQTCIQKQIRRLLPEEGKNSVQIVDNYTWLHQMDCLSFLREVGKHMTINYMIAKEAIKTRMESGISYTEFAYPLLQAYDFYVLYKEHNVKLQMGGSDQWGNITTGVELIRKKTGNQAFGLTTPLLTKADGTKFGKTEQGNVWLDPAMTSPYAFYQFWINCSDQEAALLLKKFTFLHLPTIQALVHQHHHAPHQRLLQKTLAREMTIMVHDQQTFEQVKQASEVLFSTNALQKLHTLDEQTLLEALADIPKITFTREKLHHTKKLLDLLCDDKSGEKIFSSKKLAKEMIQAGALRVNQVRITNPFHPLDFTWLWGKYLLVQKGKKHYYLIRLVG